MPVLVTSPAVGPVSAVVQLSDVKTHLRLNNVTPIQLAQLQTFIDAATAVVEFYMGEIVNRAYTESYDGGDRSIYLRHTPVLQITAISEFSGTVTYTLTQQQVGASVDSYGYTLEDAQIGRVVRRGASGYAWQFPPGTGNVRVSYVTGATEVPSVAKLAALIIVEHLWNTQRGAGPRPPSVNDGEVSVPGTYYAVPNAAVQLLQTDGYDPVIA